MSQEELEVQGTVQPDGSLVLDKKLNLPAGRVSVLVRQVSAPKSSQSLGVAFFHMLEQIRADQRARGHIPRGTVETAERRALRQEMDDEIEAAIRLQEECRRRREQAESESSMP